MLKLFLHAGLHKTGTSSFQHLCCTFKDHLLARKIYYQTQEGVDPVSSSAHAGTPQHSFLAWELQRHNYNALRSLLIRGRSALDSDGLILISGEDFENCLIDHEMAATVERIAREEGIDQVEWIFVHRRPFDYFKSLYAELSKHRVQVDLRTAAQTILQHGFLKVSAPGFDYLFAFDYDRFFDAFRKRAQASVRTIEYDPFCDVFPGHVLLDEISGGTLPLGLLQQQSHLNARLNARLPEAKVEYNYLRNRFGIERGEGFYRTWSRMVNLLLLPRLFLLNLRWQKIEIEFAAAFDRN